jgi:hypothetical protein
MSRSFLDLWQVDEQRQGREQEDTADDMMAGLRMGAAGGKKFSGLIAGRKKLSTIDTERLCRL